MPNHERHNAHNKRTEPHTHKVPATRWKGPRSGSSQLPKSCHASGGAPRRPHAWPLRMPRHRSCTAMEGAAPAQARTARRDVSALHPHFPPPHIHTVPALDRTTCTAHGCRHAGRIMHRTAAKGRHHSRALGRDKGKGGRRRPHGGAQGRHSLLSPCFSPGKLLCRWDATTTSGLSRWPRSRPSTRARSARTSASSCSAPAPPSGPVTNGATCVRRNIGTGNQVRELQRMMA